MNNPQKQNICLNSKMAFDPALIFVILAAIFGMLWVFLVPPFEVPDENRHCFRAWQISEGKFVSDVHNGLAGVWAPEGLLSVAKVTLSDFGRSEKQLSRTEFLSFFQIPLDAHRQKFVPTAAALYNPVPYLPQVPAIWLVRCLDLPAVWVIYLGRLCNLAVWICLIYVSIRLLPAYKNLFMLLVLTPMSLYQAASLSADCLTNSLAFLTVAFFASLTYESNGSIIKNSVLLQAAVFTVCLSLCKNIYFLFALLYFLLPARRLGGWKRYLFYGAVLFGANLAAVGLWGLAVRGLPVPLRSGVVPVKQLVLVVSHPLQFLTVLANTVVMDGVSLYKSFVGRLGWTRLPLPRWHTLPWVLLLIIVAALDHSRGFHIPLRKKLVHLGIFGGEVFLTVLLAYLYWNPVGEGVIDGLQGRYFIPLVPAGCFVLCSRRFSLAGAGLAVFCGTAVVLSLAYTSLLIRLYFYL